MSTYDPLDEDWWTGVVHGPMGPAAHHTVPLEAFVHLADSVGECVCGPSVMMVERWDTGDPIPFFTHQALDVRFYDGFDPDGFDYLTV